MNLEKVTKSTKANAKSVATAAGKKGKSAGEITEATQLEGSPLRNAIAVAKEMGLVVTQGSGRSTRYFKA